MIHAHVVVVKNINTVTEKLLKERGDYMVELDQFKFTLNSYQKPLMELRDSL